ncbi:MAG: transposase [Candidatus Aquicultorales bacterium]
MRERRVEYPGATYHAYTRGDNKENIFLATDDYLFFQDILGLSCSRFDFTLFAYCLMTNHIHLVIKTREEPLSKIMHYLSSRYSKYFNRVYDRVGHVFQGRYKTTHIETGGHLLEATRYVHLNPVDAKLTDDPESYPWSSMGVYLGKSRRSSESFVDPREVLGLLATQRPAQIKRYRSYVEDGIIIGRDRRRLKQEVDSIRKKKPGS